MISALMQIRPFCLLLCLCVYHSTLGLKALRLLYISLENICQKNFLSTGTAAKITRANLLADN